jgi:hypothetical protein
MRRQRGCEAIEIGALSIAGVIPLIACNISYQSTCWMRNEFYVHLIFLVFCTDLRGAFLLLHAAKLERYFSATEQTAETRKGKPHT